MNDAMASAVAEAKKQGMSFVEFIHRVVEVWNKDDRMTVGQMNTIAAENKPDVGHSTSDEDDMQFAFRLVREFLDRLDLEIAAQSSSGVSRGVALGVVDGIRAYVNQMAAIAAEKKPVCDCGAELFDGIHISNCTINHRGPR